MTAAEKIEGRERYNEEPRFERIGGTEYAMSSPGYRHRIIAGRLFGQLDAQLAKYNCLAIIAPFDVYPLYGLGDEYTLVQPDISVICDRKAGVEEYWIVDPGAGGEDDQFVSVMELKDAYYIHHAHGGKEEIPLVVIPGCTIDFGKI